MALMACGIYANKTKVSTSRSKDEIERTLKRYGASAFQSGQDMDRGVAWLMFRIGTAVIKIPIPMPKLEEFAISPAGRSRRKEVQQQEYEKATRQRWRVLALLVKAKLESVEQGITTVEKEFLGDLLLPSGQTIAEEMAPQIDAAFREGKMLKLLLQGV